MAQGYDSDIQLSVGLSYEDAKDQATKLGKAMKNIFDSVDTSKLTTSMKKAEVAMSKTASQIDEVSANITALEQQAGRADAYKILIENTSIAREELKELVAQLHAAEQAGDTAGIEHFGAEVNETRELIMMAEDAMAQLEAEGKTIFTQEDADRLATYYNRLGDLNNNARLNIEAFQALQQAETDRQAELEEANRLEEERIQIEQLDQNIMRQWASVRNQTIVDAIAKIRELQQSVVDMEAEQARWQAAGFGPGTEQFDRLTQKIGAAQREIGALQGQVNSYNQKLLDGTKETNKFANALQTMGNATKPVAKTIGNIALIGVQLSPVGRAVDKLRQKFQGLASAMTKTSKSGNNFATSMKGVIKKILTYGLGIASLTSLFGKLRNAIKEGINNLVQTNGGMNQTNQAISAMMASLKALKNAWGAAFAPVIQIVAPILTRLIDMFTATVGKISQFIAAITGKKTAIVAKKQDFNYASSLDKTGASNSKKQSAAEEKYNKAVAKVEAKNAEELAKAEEKQAKAADKLAKKQEKANKQLGAYDELNVIAKEDIGELEDIQAKQYEMPNMEDFAPDLGAGMDFDGMFEEVPIESAISDLWDRIKEAWEKADFTEIGHMVGEKLKALSDEARDWLVNVAQPLGQQIGKSFGTFINGLVETEGLAESLGNTLGEGLNTITYSINSFLDSVNWEEVGTFLGDGLNGMVDSIDWEALGHMLIMKWNALFETLVGFVNTFDFKKLGDSIGDGLTKMLEDFDAKSLASGVSGLVAGIFEAIEGFLTETDWHHLGEVLIEKLVDIITNIQWTRLIETIFACLGGLAGAALALIDVVFVKLGEWIREAWEGFVNWFHDKAYDEDGKFMIQGLLDGIIEALKNIGTWIYEHIFKPFVDAFRKAFGIQSPSKVMKELGDMLMEGLKKGIDEKIASIVKLFTTLKTKVVSVFNSLKTTVTNIWNTMWNNIKRIINSILGGVEKMANGVVRGFNRMISALNNLSFDVPDWVPEIGGKTLGFNIPQISTISIPRLAQGAVIPPNREFLALLGDQKSGTNIEAPLDTIVEAFKQALDSGVTSSGKEPIVLQLNSRTIAECVWDEDAKRYRQRGEFSPMYS